MAETALEIRESSTQALVNPSTGELIPDKPFGNEFNVSSMLATAGKVELTDKQKKILFEEVADEDIEIRQDGIVYLPWMEYASRLSEAFGLKWALIPQGMPKFKNNFVYWGFWLVIDGHLCGYAIGEQKYFPESKVGKDFMTYGDACEGAKSNALMRLCKGIGISIELWRPSRVRGWKEKYAEKTWNKKSERWDWVRKGGEKIEDTMGDDIPDFKSHPAPAKQEKQGQPAKQNQPTMATEKQLGFLHGKAKKAELTDTEAKSLLKWYTGRDENLTVREASALINDFDAILEKWQQAQPQREPGDDA